MASQMCIYLSYSLWACRLHVCASLSVALRVYICMCVCMFVWESETEPGTKEPGELDGVSQGKGGYLALRHKHSSLSQAKALKVCHSGSMKNILGKQKSAEFVMHKKVFF